jgi:hypothetical protein
MDTLQGGCFCGAVRYRTADRPSMVLLCHCSMCRRSAGAPSVAWFTVPLAGLQLSGDALTYHRSSERSRRGFCARCGTSLTFVEDGLGDIGLTVASLDDPNQLPIERHIFVPDKLAWVSLEPGLPCHVRDSGSPELPTPDVGT